MEPSRACTDRKRTKTMTARFDLRAASPGGFAAMMKLNAHATAMPRATDGDLAWPVWSGIVPLALRAAAPVPAPGQPACAAPALAPWLVASDVPG
jgi:hypothetical protein